MIEPNLTSLEISIRERFNAMSTAHVSLCSDILSLLREYTSKGRTHVDALRLAEVLTRSLKLVEKR